MLTSELKSNRIIKTWFSGIKASDSTKKAYLQGMQGYTEYTQKSPIELIEEAEKEIKSGFLMRERSILTYLMEYREGLESQELAPLTVKSRMTGVYSFYRFYHIDLPTLPKATVNARPELKRKKIPTKDDIRGILKYADPLERALILVGVSSGLSAVDISNLRVSDFLSGYDEKTCITTLHLVRQKMNYEFYTFLTPEASRAVLDYIDWRGRTAKNEGRKRDLQLEKQHITTPNGYLFVSRAIPDSYFTTKNEKEREKLRQLDERSLVVIYQRLNEEARASAGYGDYNLIRSHNMRRFFNSTLLAEHASIFFVDFLLGHKLDATHEAYYRADPKSLKDEYTKYIPYLTIEKPLDIAASADWQRIVAENEKLRLETARHIVERNELQDLRNEIQSLREERLVTQAETEQEKQITENELKKEIDELRQLVSTLAGDLFTEKKEKNKMPDW